jgi:flagellin-like protein
MIMSDIMSRRMWKAVSPLIATIILIAVTIAIAAIVIAWVYGIFGTATGPGEKLQIFADARLIITDKNVNFTVTAKNIGTAVATIQNVYIKENATCTTPTISVGSATNNQLKPGEVQTISAVFTKSDTSCSLQPGITYTVVIVTGGGQAYNVPVTAEQG